MHHPTLCHGHVVRILLCYKMVQVRACFLVNKLALLLVDFKTNVMKWKLHSVSCNFGLSLISDQIALHSVQLPLLIIWRAKLLKYDWLMRRVFFLTSGKNFLVLIGLTFHLVNYNKTFNCKFVEVFCKLDILGF